ncbi:MAG: ABC transporter permease, partial [Rikenellaceae bacterium]|nr:ABC transporter permease [Rikenellaceae bacterium]
FTIFLGSYIVGPHTKKMMPYIVFVTVLAILYIVNGFAINAQHRKHSQLTEQVKELRSKSRAINAIKMQEMRRSSILKRCQERGIELEESVVPPKIVKK